MVVRLAKYNVYRCIGCITDQSNWSRPFSLVVMMPEAVGSNPGRGTRLEVFIYKSISSSTTFGAWCQDDYCPSPSAKLCLRSQNRLGINKIIPKHLIQMFHCSMEECGSAASEVQCI